MLSTRGWMTDGGIWKIKYGKLYSKEKKPSTAEKLTILKTPIPVSGEISLIKSRADLQTRLWLVDNEAGNVISGNNLAKRLNEFYISTTSDLSLLDLRNLTAFLPAQNELPKIRPGEVCRKLSNRRILLNPSDLAASHIAFGETLLLNFLYLLRKFLMPHFPPVSF